MRECAKGARRVRDFDAESRITLLSPPTLLFAACRRLYAQRQLFRQYIYMCSCGDSHIRQRLCKYKLAHRVLVSLFVGVLFFARLAANANYPVPMPQREACPEWLMTNYWLFQFNLSSLVCSSGFLSVKTLKWDELLIGLSFSSLCVTEEINHLIAFNYGLRH